MAKSCPDCGADVTYSTRTVELLEGSCAGCGHSVVLVPPSTVPTEADRAAAASAAPTAACWDCGGTLALTVRPNRVIEAVCEDCETVTRLGVSPPAPPAGEERERPAFRRDSDRDERRPRPRDDARGDRPNARPCRQCGATLQFTQLPDGTVEGSCPSCGNRFTMRPREDRDSRGGGYGRRPSYGGGGGGGGYRRSSYGGPPRRRSFQNRSDDDEDRPRRRRRDDE
jgi:DNA-directed RNA polymerase subunit RPC12/RpoP